MGVSIWIGNEHLDRLWASG